MDESQEPQEDSANSEETPPEAASPEAADSPGEDLTLNAGATSESEKPASETVAPDGGALNEAMDDESKQAELSEAESSSIQMPDAAGEVLRAEFGPLPETPTITDRQAGNISLLLDVKLPVSIELGRTRMSIGEVLELGSGSIIELDKLAGEPVDILVNNKPLAKGEVVVLDENFGVRITSLISQRERLDRLNSQ